MNDTLGTFGRCAASKTDRRCRLQEAAKFWVFPAGDREPDVLLHVLNYVALGRSNKLPLEVE